MMGKRSMGLIAVAAILLIGCAPSDEAAEEQPADTAAAATASAANADGTWDMRSVPVSGSDTTPTLFQMQVNGNNWTLMLPNRDPITANAVMEGDSITVVAGPYNSVRREGVQVTTHSVYRVNGDQMTGTTTARYQGAGADSVLMLNSTGTRVR
jgi:hypothetical protein